MSYSRKVFIPLTNMCRDTCRYCTFVKTPESGQAELMTPEQVVTALQGQRMGCKEALFSLGEQPEKRHKLATSSPSKGIRRRLVILKQCLNLCWRKLACTSHQCWSTFLSGVRNTKPVAGSMGMMLESLSPALTKKAGTMAVQIKRTQRVLIPRGGW